MKLFIRNYIEYEILLYRGSSSETVLKTRSLQKAAQELRSLANANWGSLKDVDYKGRKQMLRLMQHSTWDDGDRWFTLATIYYNDSLEEFVML